MYWVLYRTLQERNEKQFLAFRSQHYNGRIRTYTYKDKFSSVQFSSFTQSCPTVCDPMNHSTPGPPFRHQFPEFTQTHVHRVGDAIQPSHPLSSPSPPAFNLSQHGGLFKWVSSAWVDKVLEFQLQHQSYQWTTRIDLFGIDWLDLLALQVTLKSLLQHHSSKASPPNPTCTWPFTGMF